MKNYTHKYFYSEVWLAVSWHTD